MTTRQMLILTLPVLILAAAVLGLRAGQLPSDTEILDRYAAQYVRLAGQGAALTDCSGRPHEDPAIRMVIACEAPDGGRALFFVGPRGAPVTPPEGPDA